MTDNTALEQALPHIEWMRRYNDERLAATGRRPVAHTRTYGCQQNVADGERINGLLKEMGYDFSDKVEGADLVLFNTCAIREGAEDRVFGNVGALKKEKKRNPDMLIVLCGCMTQQAHVAKRFRQSFPFVDILLGAGAMHRLPVLISGAVSSGERVFETLDPTFPAVENLPIRRDGTARAWLPIMYGCDNFCTYCVVPMVRGRERSRASSDIIKEAAGLIAEGYKEITLLGQNVNSYGKGLEDAINFSGLLRQLCALPGDFRLRFMTSHPKDCTTELLDVMASEEKLYNHLHLPVQSGSDNILSRMNRHYDVGRYKALIDYARAVMPDITITSDIIVGFPGETEEEFEETLDLVRYVGYQSLYTFIFSSREGTPAAKMDDPITPEEKSRRFERLLVLQNEITQQAYDKTVGKTQLMLVDGFKKPGEPLLTGRSQSNMVVDLDGAPELIGKLIKVKITRSAHWALHGEPV